MTWEALRLKRLFTSSIGGSWGSEPEGADVVLPCVRGTDFNYGHLRVNLSRAPMRGFTHTDVAYRAARSGDLIIEKSGGGEQQPVGRAVLYNGSDPVMPTNFAGRLRPNQRAEPRFAAYLLASLYTDGRTRAAIKQTTGIQNLDLDALLDNTVSVPAVGIQRTIADFLDRETARVDALITAKRRLLDTLEERWQTVMWSAASGLLTHTGDLRAAESPWLTSVPQHWREGKLTLVARLGSGHTPSRQHPEWWVDPTVPWITTGEVAQMRTDRIEQISATREMISVLGLANSSATVHPAGTVVLCRTASAGYSAIMGRDMATSQDFATWTCGPLLRPRFLLLCLRAMRQDLLGRLAMGSTHQTIYMPDIEAIRVPVPPLQEQDSVVEAAYDRLAPVDASVSRLKRQVDLLVERRQALITAAVTGQLEIPGVAA